MTDFLKFILYLKQKIKNILCMYDGCLKIDFKFKTKNIFYLFKDGLNCFNFNKKNKNILSMNDRCLKIYFKFQKKLKIFNICMIDVF